MFSDAVCAMARVARAAGLIICRFNQEIEYLLMQTSYGHHHWTPPKGHVDPGESDWTAALRETKEEAGLEERDFDIVDNFKVQLNYTSETPHRGREDKCVTYWLAVIKSPEVSVNLSEEHQDFW